MKEDLDGFCKDIIYEEVFGPFEVRPFMQRKRLIETHSIMVAVNNLERKYILGEERKSSHLHFSFTWIVFTFVDNMYFLEKIFKLKKERDARAFVTTPSISSS